MTLVQRDGGISRAAGIQCEHIDDTGPCPYDAVQRCTGNWCHGSVYCVRHIRYLNSQYICDTCIREAERFERREEAAAKERKRIEDAEVAAFLRSIYVTQEKFKIRYPRIMILLSIILLVSFFLTQSVYTNQHPDNPSLFNLKSSVDLCSFRYGDTRNYIPHQWMDLGNGYSSAKRTKGMGHLCVHFYSISTSLSYL